MKDYSKDEFVKAIRAGKGMWKPADEQCKYYEDMSDKHIKNCIENMEKTKTHWMYEDIRSEFEEKIKEMNQYLKSKKTK